MALKEHLHGKWITAVPARQLVRVVNPSSNQGYLFQQQMTWLDTDGRGWETQFHISIWAHWLWCMCVCLCVACVWYVPEFRIPCNSIHHLSSCISSLLIMTWIHLSHYFYAPAKWRIDILLSYAHQGSIYFIKNTVQTVILLNNTIYNNCFVF